MIEYARSQRLRLLVASALLVVMALAFAAPAAAVYDDPGNIAVTDIEVRWADAGESTDLRWPISNSKRTYVNSIDVSLTESNITVGETSQASAIVYPRNASNKTYDWSSSDESVATVDYHGVVTAVGPGDAEIVARATDGSGTTGSASITVEAAFVPVESIFAYGPGRSPLVLLLGSETADLDADVSPSNATKTTVTWSWDEPDASRYASIDPVTGVITPIPGAVNPSVHLHAVATVIGGGRDGANTSGRVCVVLIGQTSVESISVSLDDESIELGGAATVARATVEPATASNKDVMWSSSDESVATVDAEGNVTAVAGGTADIIATAADGSDKWGSAKVTVLEQVTSIDITADTVMERGYIQTATAEVGRATATDRSVTWISSDSDVVSVDPETGVVTATGKGGANIVALANDSSEVSDSIWIDVVVSVTDIDVTLSDDNITIRGRSQAAAALTPLDPSVATVKWSSSDTDVATVDSDGLVKAVGVGKADITATATDGLGISGSATITVRPVPRVAVQSVSVAVTGNSLEIGQTSQASAAVLPADASNPAVVWSSTDESVLTVDPSGLVTAVAPGTASVKASATDGSGIFGVASITVKAAVVKTWVATPLLSTTSPKVGRSFYIRSSIAPKVANGSKPVVAKIQKRRANGTWYTVKTVRMTASNSSAQRSSLRALTKITSRGTYRVRVMTVSGQAAISTWRTFRVR